MKNKEATAWLYKFYKVLKERGTKVKIQKNMTDPNGNIKRPKFGIPGLIAGLNSRDTKEIFLNPSRQVFGGIVRILVHELIHEVDFNMNEENVRKLENEIYDALTSRQLTNLLRRAFTN